jgi:catechol 2,3-dioxygenase-like lactoylglutathione lyase family enzyme
MIESIDHVAFPTSDAERLIEFYARLGFTIVGAQQWRDGESPVFSIVIGSQMLNVHPETLVARRGEPWYLRAPAAEPGCADLCFVWSGGVDALLAHLARANIPVLAGPAPRRGGRQGGTQRGQSLYLRDPDDNLLEFMCY